MLGCQCSTHRQLSHRLSYSVVLHFAGSSPPSLGAPTVVFRSAPLRRLIAAVIGSTDCRIKSHVFLSFGSVFFLFALALETKRKKMNKVGLKCKTNIKAHFAPVGISRRCARLSYVAFVVLHYAGSTPPSLGAPAHAFKLRSSPVSHKPTTSSVLCICSHP